MKLSEKLLTQTFQNPFYCGLITSSLQDGQVVAGRHEAMISPERFMQLNNMQQQQEHSHAHAKEVPPVPLKHHVTCHRCGKPLTGYQAKKKQLWYYKCNTIGCKLNVSARQLHSPYHELLGSYDLSPQLVAPLKAITVGVFQQLYHESVQERKAIQAALKQVQQKLEKMEERYAIGELGRTTNEKFSRKIITSDLQPLAVRYARLGSDLSNLESYVYFAVDMTTNLPIM
ncbi:zinc ribbon domain-containing protein [Hymenobacter sp. 15J16-1T3B]|uniref:zinc ribbon domain-containing protein n=1 Tax=Hymenobacter sp. 15J16-1T3B TaxID=2886941 RepID=UPI001D11B0D4|nr:zinc ribbon domain-containing protein [Hymenobacter sp. 15J16-1T3B]MCC3158628.1 zinc ribbon domain-containing protein [Hymenobacter sp. 15J16-1T3B]